MIDEHWAVCVAATMPAELDDDMKKNPVADYFAQQDLPCQRRVCVASSLCHSVGVYLA